MTQPTPQNGDQREVKRKRRQIARSLVRGKILVKEETRGDSQQKDELP